MGGLFIFYYTFFAGIAMCWLNDNYKTFKIPKLYLMNTNYRKLFEYIFPLFLLILLLKTPFLDYWVLIVKLVLTALIFYFMGRLLVYYLKKDHKNFFKSKAYDIISKISFSSYAIYLLHVTIFLIIVDTLIKFQLSGYQTLIIAIFGIPISFIAGYYVQLGENKLIRYINWHKAGGSHN